MVQGSVYLKVEEVAERFRVNRATVDKWIADGRLQAVRVKKVIRVSESAIAEFLAKQTSKAGAAGE